jgi:MFS transporter, DHA1 family, multidrug resistance protein
VPRLQRGPFRDLPPEVATLTAISFTVALGFGIVAPSIPSFARHFGVSNAAAATVISAFALMRVVGALPAGRLTDRFGEHWVMAAGIAIVAVSSILAGFSASFTQLIVLRGIGGLGSAMFSISARTLLLVSVPGEHRGRASGLFAGGFLVGGITGPAIGGLVAAWSPRAPFFIYGGMLVVPALIAAARLRNAPRLAVPHDARAARLLAELAQALRSRAYLAAASANLADGFAVIGVRSAIVPLFVRDVLHRSAVWTGIGFGVVAVLNAAALLPSGRVADTRGRRPVIIAGCLASAAGLVMLALLPGLWGYLAALAVFGLGSGLLDVAPSAMIGDILGGGGGTLVASFQMAGDIGAVVGPVAAGFLVDRASYGAAFGLAAVVLVLAAFLGVLAPETRWQDRVVSPPE